MDWIVLSGTETSWLLFLWFVCLAIIGCREDQQTKHSPTIPTGVHVIIVDSQTAKAVPPPCGKPDAVCATLTDGLASAALLGNEMATLWIQPGNYAVEPAYPIEINFPVILHAAQEQTVTISADRQTLQIAAPRVKIEGLKLITQGVGDTKTVVVQDGDVTLTQSTISLQRHPADPRGTGLSITRGGQVTLENSRVESAGTTGVEILDGKLTASNSAFQAEVDALAVHAKGRAAVDNCRFQGNIFVTAGSLTAMNSQTLNIGIWDGGYGTLTDNTIRGDVTLGWKQAYANLAGNLMSGRVFAVQASAKLETNAIYGNAAGEGIVASNFAALTLTGNTIFGAQPLRAEPYAKVTLKHNQFEADVHIAPAILCAPNAVVQSDGANIFKNPHATIACDDLPVNPGANPF